MERVDTEQYDAVFFDGTALRFILRDATLGRLFISLCSMGRVSVGSGISIHQKRDLTRLLRGYAHRGNLGYVMSLVSSTADRYMLSEADVTVGLRAVQASQPELLAHCDIQMDHFYALTYLLFKHGTLAHRR